MTIKIKTPFGYENFNQIRKTTHSRYVHLVFDDLSELKCSLNHFLQKNNSFIAANDLVCGDVIQNKTVMQKTIIEDSIELYDAQDTESHTYYTNGLISHNCHFLSSKGTLVNSMVLEGLKPQEPVHEYQDWSLWSTDLKGRTLAIAIDPGEGINEDYHAVQIVDIETMEQIGEYRNNNLSQTLFTQELINIFGYLFKNKVKDIYYTVECNGIGIGVLNLLQNSEDPVMDQVHLISSKKKKGIVMSTVTKKNGCMKLKDMIETKRFKINSKRLLSELKFFVKTGETYRAESGKHDDLAMACVLIMLLFEKIAMFEEHVYETFNDLNVEVSDEHDHGDPMGIFI